MLPRKSLFPLRGKIRSLQQAGKIYSSESFGLLVSFAGAGSDSQSARVRCSFVVSKKVDRSSVVRHQVKRKLSEAITPFLDRLPRSTVLVFLAKPQCCKTTGEDLTRELRRVLGRAGLLEVSRGS